MHWSNADEAGAIIDFAADFAATDSCDRLSSGAGCRSTPLSECSKPAETRPIFRLSANRGLGITAPVTNKAIEAMTPASLVVLRRGVPNMIFSFFLVDLSTNVWYKCA
jgi:hypothetical protein